MNFKKTKSTLTVLSLASLLPALTANAVFILTRHLTTLNQNGRLALEDRATAACNACLPRLPCSTGLSTFFTLRPDSLRLN